MFQRKLIDYLFLSISIWFLRQNYIGVTHWESFVENYFRIKNGNLTECSKLSYNYKLWGRIKQW